VPEIIRSLIVVLVISSIFLGLTRKYFVATFSSKEEYDARWKIWVGITLVMYLSQSYLALVCLSIIFILYFGKADTNKLGMYTAILFAVPLFKVQIPGLGLMNYFFELSYARFLNIFLLLPIFFKLLSVKHKRKFRIGVVDRFIALYVILALALQVELDSFTNTLRTAFDIFIDILLPYFVVSRSIRSVEDFVVIMSAFVLSSMLLGLMGVFEFSKGWLLYSNIPSALGLEWGYGGYLLRGQNVRALATTGQAIVLGYVLAVALGFYSFLLNRIANKNARMLGWLVLLAGLISPLSRGPWIGAALMVIVFIATGAEPIKTIAKLAFYGGVVFFVVALMPFGSGVVDHLPFLGTVDADTVLYRERLLDSALQVIWRHPYFGSFDYMQTAEMESLRSGGENGIIDIVNTYLSIALSMGLVGLFLFAGIFVSVLTMVLLATQRAASHSASLHILGRALLATLVGIAIIIYTVSSIGFIPIIYWIVVGMGVAYVNLVNRCLPT
jgi:hypothetical protein